MQRTFKYRHSPYPLKWDGKTCVTSSVREEDNLHSRSYRPPCFHSHPSLSGLKKVCIRSLPSSSGILNGSVLILSYSDTSSSRGRSPPSLIPLHGASPSVIKIYFPCVVQVLFAGWHNVECNLHLKRLEGKPVPVHRDELLRRRLVLHRRVVQRGVKHDDGERQHVARVRVGEYVRVQLAVPLREGLHHPIYLLRLARQPEGP